MSFADIAFPFEVRTLNATPAWPVDIIKLGGGGEQRILLQGDSRRHYEFNFPHILLSRVREFYEFFNARRAQTHSFKIVDKTLWRATGEPLGTGGGVDSTNQLIIDEGDATNSYIREVYLPKSGTVHIFAGVTEKTQGVDWTLNYNGVNGGLVTWLTSVSGQTLTWTGEFYIPVRFDTGSLPDVSLVMYTNNDTGAAVGPSVPMVEVDFKSEFV